MHPLTSRFVIAGTVFIVGGIAIAVTREGVGEHAPWIGGLVALIGGALIVSGVMRHWKRED